MNKTTYFNKWLFRAAFFTIALLFLYGYAKEGTFHTMTLTCPEEPGRLCLNQYYCDDSFCIKNAVCKQQPDICSKKYLEPGETIGTFKNNTFALLKLTPIILLMAFWINHLVFMLKKENIHNSYS